MAARKKSSKRSVRKKRSGKAWFIPGIGRLFLFFLLFFILVFSLFSAGYVIFFRTVFAQEIMPVLKSSIVFEEPDPPVILETTPVIVEEQIEIVPSFPEKEALVELPKVAIIVDDIGYQREVGKQLFDIPVELTFSFLPFAPFTKELEAEAYNQGKTVFLHLPLQPQSKAFNPGPGALTLMDTPKVQRIKLQKCLSEVPHAMGVNNHMGSRYTEDRAAMVMIMEELASRSLSFVDSYTTSSSVGLDSARKIGVRSARRNVFLDNKLTHDHICSQLTKLVKIAKSGGVGIGIAHPHEVTLEALRTCTQDHLDEVEFVGVLEVL